MQCIENYVTESSNDLPLLDLRGMIHDQIGNIERQVGDSGVAIIHYDECLQINSRLYGDDSPEYAETLKHKGQSLANMNKLDKAIQAFNQCLEIFTKNEDTKQIHRQSIAWTYCNLGNVYYTKGDHDKALERYERSLELEMEIHGKLRKNEYIAAFLMNIGHCHLFKKDFDVAFKFFNDALQTMFSVYNSKDKDDDLIADIHYNLAKCFVMDEKTRDLNKALFHANTSHKMSKRLFVDEQNKKVVDSMRMVENIEALLARKTENTT